MLLMSVGIIVALLAGSCLLALVSDAFADALSRNVEAAFDHFEYRAALRRSLRRDARPSAEETTYAATLQRAARA
jgi:hypothetical protein